MFDDIRHRLAQHNPVQLDPLHDSRDRAAVLVPLVVREEPAIVFTERAGALNNHGGEVSFPGGRVDSTDESLAHAALRENEEELGINAGDVEIVGELRPCISKYGLLVTPFVGVLPRGAIYLPNDDEVASVFEVPISYFDVTEPARIDAIERHGERHEVLVYDFDGYEIWGLTAMILREFLEVVRSAD